MIFTPDRNRQSYLVWRFLEERFGSVARRVWLASILCCAFFLSYDAAVVAQTSSYVLAASEKSRQTSSEDEKREFMRKQLMVDANGVQTRFPAVAKIVGRAESQMVDDSYATVPLFYGTGEYVAQYGPWGIVLTNWHVVSESNKSIEVCFPSKTYPGRVVLRDEKWDLAALIIPKPENIIPIPISLNVPYFQDRLWAGGYGPTEGLDDFELHEGRLTNYVSLDLPRNLKKEGETVLEDDGALYETEMINVGVRSGDSGGPIFNEFGELAGCLWGSDKKSSMGTNGPRMLIFVMEAIQEAAILHAQKALDAETTQENPDVVLTIGQAPNVCVKANVKLSSYAEEDAFAIIRQLTKDDLAGKARDFYKDFDVAGIETRLYPTSTSSLYVSGNGVDTPESLRKLGQMKMRHVRTVAAEYWRRNPGGLPPSPPIYSPGYLGLQTIFDRDRPELVAEDSFDALDARALRLAENGRRPKIPGASPLDDWDGTKQGAEFQKTSAHRPYAAQATDASEAPSASGGADSNPDAITAATAPPVQSRDDIVNITQLQAYALFSVILMLLCASAILLRSGDSQRNES